MLFFTHIKVVASMLACAHSITCIKWRRLILLPKSSVDTKNDCYKITECSVHDSGKTLNIQYFGDNQKMYPREKKNSQLIKTHPDFFLILFDINPVSLLWMGSWKFFLKLPFNQLTKIRSSLPVLFDPLIGLTYTICDLQLFQRLKCWTEFLRQYIN